MHLHGSLNTSTPLTGEGLMNDSPLHAQSAAERVQARDPSTPDAEPFCAARPCAQSEYPPECDARRAFISGFDGSAGTAVVTTDVAALWTDGRYFLQARRGGWGGGGGGAFGRYSLQARQGGRTWRLFPSVRADCRRRLPAANPAVCVEGQPSLPGTRGSSPQCKLSRPSSSPSTSLRRQRRSWAQSGR